MFSFITTLLFWAIWSLGFFLYVFLAIFSWWNSTYIDIFYSVKLKLSYNDRHETWYLNHLMGLATVNCWTSVISFQRKIVFLTLFFWYSGNLALFPGGLKWLASGTFNPCLYLGEGMVKYILFGTFCICHLISHKWIWQHFSILLWKIVSSCFIACLRKVT